MAATLPLNCKVGIVGGGQLGRMLTQAAHRLGLQVGVSARRQHAGGVLLVLWGRERGCSTTTSLPQRTFVLQLRRAELQSSSQVVDPGGDACACACMASPVIKGGLKDAAACEELSKWCDVMTLEIEHVVRRRTALAGVFRSWLRLPPSARCASAH